jgi:ribA/ribD-fused uncharacterized protein
VIGRFRGRHRFLSNFFPCIVAYGGIAYPSVEHAYQAAKTLDDDLRRSIASLSTAGEAKAFGSKLRLRPDWEEVKVQVMRELLLQKFEDPQLMGWLLDTGEEELVEGNTWGDTFWGVCGGAGLNHLGRLLMEVRALLRARVQSIGAIVQS